jgi:hypothetical protein
MLRDISTPDAPPGSRAGPALRAPLPGLLRVLVVALLLGAGAAHAQGLALRFYGHGLSAPDLDRVKIAIDAPPTPADVGGDLTLEWWMSALVADNGSGPCIPGNDNWITGNILLDRDIFGGGDYGDYGVALHGGRIAFGVHNGSWGEGIC